MLGKENLVRISELSRRSGVPTATIKYYLREGLLPAGQLTAATQAQYDDDHLGRLRLIRALLGPGRLSIAEIRGVLDVVDDPPDSPMDLLGRASGALGRVPAAEQSDRPDDGAGQGEADDPGRAAAQSMIDELGWSVATGSKAQTDLAEALVAIEQAQLTLVPGGVAAYAEELHKLAVAELDTIGLDSPEAAVRQAVLGTILIEPLILALRRLALEDAAGRRFGAGNGPLP